MKELEATKKEIDSLIAKRTNLTTALIISIGGTIGISLHLTNFLYITYFILGLIAVVLTFTGALNIEQRIKCLLEELK